MIIDGNFYFSSRYSKDSIDQDAVYDIYWYREVSLFKTFVVTKLSVYHKAKVKIVHSA